MTALAIRKSEIAAEISFAVMTSRASLPARVAEMLGRCSRTDLSRLSRAGSEFVAVSACESLARTVFRMTEREPERARVSAGRAIRFLIVTDAARSNLAACV